MFIHTVRFEVFVAGDTSIAFLWKVTGCYR